MSAVINMAISAVSSCLAYRYALHVYNNNNNNNNNNNKHPNYLSPTDVTFCNISLLYVTTSKDPDARGHTPSTA